MSKGSQLLQLKTALSHAGITGQSQSNGKKRKRTGSHEQDREKKAAKLNEIHQKLNPFDVKVTKLKHDVGGRKLKGITGRPAQSKQAGLEQRKKTLLKEYEERGRAGGVVDRRFGEDDPTLSLEERMLERFTKERQRVSKGAAFNLEDEEDLTHYGQSLSKLDDFDNVGLGLDDDDDGRGQIDRDVVKKTHFGGFSDDEEEGDDEPARKKSKAEVMAEVMAKSKEHKLRRQMEREQEDNLRHELDQDFDSLRSLLYAPDPSSTGSNSVPLGRIREDTTKVSTGTTAVPAVENDGQDYDTHVRELAFDKRAQPKDRTKTEEELALDEKERLEKAERKRRRRMLGEDEGESDEDEGKGRGRSKRKRERGADDLDDDFHEDEGLGGLGTGLGVEVNPNSGASSDGGSDSSEDDEDDEAGEDSEDSKSEADFDEDSEAEEGDHNDLTTARKSGKTSSKHQKSKELPFTFPCPETHEEFLEIVEEVEDSDVPTVVKRIRALYHPSLAPENKFKLQTLTTVLIDHILYITSPPSPRFGLLSSFLSHLFTLTESYPIQSAEYFVEKLSLMHKNLKRGLAKGALDPEARTWPGLAELSLFRVIGIIWPTSDMNHAVISPARLLMGAYLGLCRVRSLTDIASGLFLCTLYLQFEHLSKRFVPEVINFLVNTVLHLCPHQFKDASLLPGSFPSPDFVSDPCRPLNIKAKKVGGLTVDKPNLVGIMCGDPLGEQTKVDLLALAIDLLGRFADMYKSLDGFIELYQPIHDITSKLDANKLPKELQSSIASLDDATSRLLNFSTQARQPLALQAHKPIPIPTYIPKFESTSSSYLRRQDPDHERNEASKLRYQYKQERKGAIRELRKDSRFLAAVEQKKQSEKDRAYKDSIKKVFGSIEGERAEQKAMEREKSREKKRSGRK